MSNHQNIYYTVEDLVHRINTDPEYRTLFGQHMKIVGEPDASGDCILWKGTYAPGRYGQPVYFPPDGRGSSVPVGRLVWLLASCNARVPADHWVYRTCNNRQCVNPLHRVAYPSQRTSAMTTLRNRYSLKALVDWREGSTSRGMFLDPVRPWMDQAVQGLEGGKRLTTETLICMDMAFHIVGMDIHTL